MAAPSTLASPSERDGAATRGSDFAELMRRVRAAGLLERRRGYYLAKIAVTGGLLATAWTVFVVMGDSWWQLAVAGFLAVVFAQMRSYAQAIRYLHDVGRPLRASPAG